MPSPFLYIATSLLCLGTLHRNDTLHEHYNKQHTTIFTGLVSKSSGKVQEDGEDEAAAAESAVSAAAATAAGREQPEPATVTEQQQQQ